MKRTPLRRGKPLRPQKTKKRWDERAQNNYGLALPKPMRYRDDAYLAWIRTLDCILKRRADHRCWGSVQACHIKTRGSGGGDDQVFPGCAAAHAEQEGRTARFEELWGVDLGRIARQLRARYERES